MKEKCGKGLKLLEINKTEMTRKTEKENNMSTKLKRHRERQREKEQRRDEQYRY